MPKNQRIQKKHLLEAALFSAGRPVTREELGQATGLSQKELEPLLRDLITYYGDLGNEDKTALEIGRAGDKYVMQVRARYAHCGKNLAPMEIPEKLLGTLALIAYHQPIRQSQLRDMIGQKVYDHVKELLDHGLLLAQKEGRTRLLSTSDSFPEYFGLSTTNTDEIRNFLLGKLRGNKTSPPNP